MDLKVGTVLIAKDPCIMTQTKIAALIVGKEYDIKWIDLNRNEFTVESEYDKNHYFTIMNDGKPNSNFNFYFDIKN
jgi:hypothetical protein